MALRDFLTKTDSTLPTTTAQSTPQSLRGTSATGDTLEGLANVFSEDTFVKVRRFLFPTVDEQLEKVQEERQQTIAPESQREFIREKILRKAFCVLGTRSLSYLSWGQGRVCHASC